MIQHESDSTINRFMNMPNEQGLNEVLYFTVKQLKESLRDLVPVCGPVRYEDIKYKIRSSKW